jgi:hypothetical protein
VARVSPDVFPTPPPPEPRTPYLQSGTTPGATDGKAGSVDDGPKLSALEVVVRLMYLPSSSPTTQLMCLRTIRRLAALPQFHSQARACSNVHL